MYAKYTLQKNEFLPKSPILSTILCKSKTDFPHDINTLIITIAMDKTVEKYVENKIFRFFQIPGSIKYADFRGISLDRTLDI